MPKKRIILISLLTITIMILSACSQQASTDTPAPDLDIEEPTEEVITKENAFTEAPTKENTATNLPTETATEPEEQEPPEESTEDEGAQMEALISEKISGCHNLNFILSQNKTAEEWSVTIDRMIGKGAKINEEEKEMIINWLISRNQ